MAINYVKFQRGTQAAYNVVKQNGRLDENTLYFIYNDANDPDAGGLLYLGSRLIGGTGAGFGATALSDLTDTNIDGINLADGMILQYVVTAQKWAPVTLSTALGNADYLPSVSSVTKTEGQTDAQALAAAEPNPAEGDIVFVDGTPYIYDGENWHVLAANTSALESRVSAVETDLQAVDGKISTAIANANHLTYQVQSELPTITEANVGDLENIVMLVPNASAPAGSGDLYDEFMVINGAFEKLGSWSANLNNYVTTTDFNTAIGNINDSISSLTDTVDGLVTTVSNFSTDYVPLIQYNAEVGDLSRLLTATGKESTSIVDEILEIEAALKWADIE